MLDIKFIVDNISLVKQSLENKKEKADLEKLVNLYEEKKRLQYDFDNIRAEQKKASGEVARLKKEKKDANEILKNLGIISEKTKSLSSDLKNCSREIDEIMITIPNLADKTVPVGLNSEENQEIRKWSEQKQFDFQPKDHLELSKDRFLDLIRGAKITGNGFPVYYGKGALLERALINFMLDFHVKKHGYTELWIPFLANRKAMTGTGQIPKLEDDMYHLKEDELYLIPTSEVPVTNFFADEILDQNSLPQKFVAFSPCFRREAGSYGKETKGLQRIHQFNKVEMVRFVEQEQSMEALEEMVNNAESILQALGLHYRVVKLCTGDMSFASAITYDIEVWAPGSNKYLEVSSISNFKDFQARRMNIRYRDAERRLKYVHTLNGSGLATPRTFIALTETFQNKDGSISIPKALQPYLNTETL